MQIPSSGSPPPARITNGLTIGGCAKAVAFGISIALPLLLALFLILAATDQIRRPHAVHSTIVAGLGTSQLAARDGNGTLNAQSQIYGTNITYYSECLLYSMVLGSEAPSLGSSLRSWIDWNPVPPHHMGDYCTFVSGVILDGASSLKIPYQRYWHGYRIVYNLAFSYGSINHLHIAICILLLAATFWLWRALIPALGWASAAICAVAIWALSDLYAGFVQVSQMTSTVVLLSVSALSAQLVTRARDAGPELVILLAIPSGAALNFFDFLITPGASAAFYACVVLAAWLARGEERAPREAVLLAAFTAFLGGFAMAWATKWALVAVLNQLSGINLPPVSAGDFQRYLVSSAPHLFGQAIVAQIHVALALPLFPFALLVLAAWIALALARGRSPRMRDLRLMILAFACFFLASEIMAPHTIVHKDFTHRAVSLCLSGLAIIVLALARRSPPASHDPPGALPAPLR